jgi:hypothetical protein
MMQQVNQINVLYMSKSRQFHNVIINSLIHVHNKRQNDYIEIYVNTQLTQIHLKVIGIL